LQSYIRSKKFTETVLEIYEIDAIVHTAEIANLDCCEKHPVEARVANIDGIHKMLQSCRNHDYYFHKRIF